MSESEIITPATARSRGLKWYFTGVPCPRGHVAKRNLSNRECRHCIDAKAKRSGRALRKDRRRQARVPDKRREQSRKSHKNNVEKRRAYDHLRYHTDPERNARAKLQGHTWWRFNRGKKNEMTARRRWWVKRATPPWLSTDQRRAIRKIYIEASTRDGDWHVDHVVPLRNPVVCGLHVPWNLQILGANLNRAKRNTFSTEDVHDDLAKQPRRDVEAAGPAGLP